MRGGSVYPIIWAIPKDNFQLADVSLSVSFDGEATWNSIASGVGTFTTYGRYDWNVPTVNSPLSVRIDATDAAGNVSSDVSGGHVIDSAAPTAPTLNPLASPTAINALVVSGMAEASARIDLYRGSAPFSATQADDTGAFTITTAPLADGAHTFTATATDAAGNVSPLSADVSVVIDTIPPQAPVIASPQSGIELIATFVTIQGTAEPESTVTLYDTGVFVSSSPAGIDGTFAFSLDSLLDGTHRYTASATDAAGKVSSASNPVDVIVDTTYLNGNLVLELRDSLGNLIGNSGATVLIQPNSNGEYLSLDDGLLHVTGSEATVVADGTHRFRLMYRGATQTQQVSVLGNTSVVFQTQATTVELRDSSGNFLSNSGATVEYQPGSTGGYLPFGNGVLSPTGVESMELLAGNHRYRLAYGGASQTVQTDAHAASFHTQLFTMELKDSLSNLTINSGAAIEVQPGSNGAYVPFGDDGILNPAGSESMELLPGTHRFRLIYGGVSLTIQDATGGATFQTHAVALDLRDSLAQLTTDSGAVIEVQPGSSGAYLLFGDDGVLDASGSETMELLPGNHRYRLAYRGATQTIQTDTTTVAFQTRSVMLVLKDSAGNLTANSGATVEVQPGSSGSYVPFGDDGVLSASGSETMELLAGNHRYRLAYRGATQTIQTDALEATFQTLAVTVELRNGGGNWCSIQPRPSAFSPVPVATICRSAMTEEAFSTRRVSSRWNCSRAIIATESCTTASLRPNKAPSRSSCSRPHPFPTTFSWNCATALETSSPIPARPFKYSRTARAHIKISGTGSWTRTALKRTNSPMGTTASD